MDRTKRILAMAVSSNYNEDPDDLNVSSTDNSVSFPPTESMITEDVCSSTEYNCQQEHNAGYIEVEPIIIQNSLCTQHSPKSTINSNKSSWDDVNDNIIIIEELQVASDFLPNTVFSSTSLQTETTTNDYNSYGKDDNKNDNDWVPPDESVDEDSNSDKDAVSVPIQEETKTNQRQRKRKRDPKSWKKNKIAFLRQKGLQYHSLVRTEGVKRGEVLRSKRKMGPRCTSDYCVKSKKRFCASISDEIREQLFNHFWEQLSWDDRKSFVISLVDCVVPKQKRRIESGDRRSATFHYHFKIDSERREVCRDMFCNTLSIGVWSVKNWAGSAFHGMRSKKYDSKNKKDKPTRRGNTFIQPMNQTKDLNPAAQNVCHMSSNTRKRKHAEDFINSLPKLESHYCRRDSSKLYLEPIFQSTMELYRLYLENCREHAEKSVSRFTFTDILDSNNISLFVPRKDQCDICCQHSTGNLSDEEYNAHIQAKNKARAEKEDDKERAISKECVVFTVDVQAVKLSPCLKASSLYYKTKLCCHNYTVFNLANQEVNCYWWHEGEGELKASNFTSCLIQHLEETINSWPDDISRKEIIIWSDGCGYQNKNKTIANAISQLSMKTSFIIEQKFLQKGHTQMEVDSVHATIEKRLKNRNIYLPEDYVTVTKEARIKKPYRTHYLLYSFFKDYTINEAEIYSSIRPGNKVNDPTINHICHLKYTPDGLIRYKLDFEDELAPLPRRSTSRKEFVYPALYNNRLKIKKSKWDHLQQLKSVIPQYAHEFYDNLLY